MHGLQKASVATAAALVILGRAGLATAEPMATMDRNGTYVLVETFAPNTVRMTVSQSAIRSTLGGAKSRGMSASPCL